MSVIAVPPPIGSAVGGCGWHGPERETAIRPPVEQ